MDFLISICWKPWVHTSTSSSKPIPKSSFCIYVFPFSDSEKPIYYLLSLYYLLYFILWLVSLKATISPSSSHNCFPHPTQVLTPHAWLPSLPHVDTLVSLPVPAAPVLGFPSSWTLTHASGLPDVWMASSLLSSWPPWLDHPQNVHTSLALLGFWHFTWVATAHRYPPCSTWTPTLHARPTTEKRFPLGSRFPVWSIVLSPFRLCPLMPGSFLTQRSYPVRLQHLALPTTVPLPATPGTDPHLGGLHIMAYNWTVQ